jgi:3-hydroxyisobutyrate dehydrogenase-like beta-hydroxyacid dehydrogenase
VTIGFIGFDHVGRVLAAKSIQAGNRVILSNRNGPASLSGYVAALGLLAAGNRDQLEPLVDSSSGY